MHCMLIWTKNFQSRLKQSEYICDAVEVLIRPIQFFLESHLTNFGKSSQTRLCIPDQIRTITIWKKKCSAIKRDFLLFMNSQVLSGPVFKRKSIADKSWFWPKPQLLPHSRYNCPPCVAKHWDKTRQGWMDIKGLLTYFTSLFLLENMHPNIYHIFLLPFLNISLNEFAISCRSGNRKSGAITLMSTWLPPQVLLVGTSLWIW